MPENWVVLDFEQVKSSRMQDMHGIGEGGGGGRLIGAGDRRLRPLNHQAVKCPRCDSINTKFCYYNNYNLSQPRYFCKSCRRYWTKGGVLRNVPVGGGCRKSKRSKPKINDDAKSTAVQTSSSDTSSSLTTSAAAAAPTSDAAKVGSAPIYTASDSGVMYNFADASFSNVNPQPNPNPDPQPLDNQTPAGGEIFSSEIGSFSGLMTSSEELMMGMDIATTSYSLQQPVAENPKVDAELKMEDMSNEAVLDWGSASDGGDQGLFDLTAGVDPAYWSQSDWTDNDQSLNYLP